MPKRGETCQYLHNDYGITVLSRKLSQMTGLVINEELIHIPNKNLITSNPKATILLIACVVKHKVLYYMTPISRNEVMRFSMMCHLPYCCANPKQQE